MQRFWVVIVGAVILIPGAAALAQGQGFEAPSDFVESISTPTEESAGVMGESDAIYAEEDALADGDAPAFVGSSRRRQVEEIVVSARKRSELLEDTPVSVTALSETTLREAGVNRIDDIQELVPNLTFQNSSTGTEALVYIRGVGLPRALISFDPGVGIYLDGVFLPRAQGSLLDVIDIAQVEVLRGPQGTLFGKNTVGGAVNFTTQKPTDEVEAFAFIQFGNIDAPRSHGVNLVNSRAMLNLPIGVGFLEDRASLRLAFASQNRAGYMYNTLRDESWDDRDSLAFLGSLRLEPVDDVTIDLSGSWDHSNSYGPGGECLYVQPSGLQALTPGLAEYCESERPEYQFAANWPQTFQISSFGSWGVLNWDVGELPGLDNLSVKALGSWRQQNIRSRQDTDLTPAPAVNASRWGSVGVPVPPGVDPDEALDGRPTKQQQFQGELQVNGSALDEHLNFVAGYFVFWENASVQGGTRALVDSINTRNVQPQYIDNWTWAIYSQASYDFLEWFQLTGGLRYTEDKKGVTSQQFNCIPTGPGGSCSGYSEAFDQSNSAISSAWSPMVTLSSTVPPDLLEVVSMDHLMTYFTWSRGFRGGGFNVIPQPVPGTDELALQSFEPETLDSYEVGVKTLAWDRRVSTNLSVFLADYDNIQVTSIRDLGDTDGDGSPEIAQETLNAASARTWGLELETLVTPSEGLRLEGSLGMFKSDYKEFIGPSDMTSELIDRSGESFNRVPEFQAHAAIQYSLPVELASSDFMSGYLTPRIDWYYQSKVHFFGPEYYPGRQPGYNLLHARLSYSFNGDQSQFALWAQNLTNERYLTNSVPLVTSFGVAQQLYGATRTYGAEFSHRF